MQRKNAFVKLIRDKGYYIVLALCAIAVGVSGYLFCRNLAADETVLPKAELSARPAVTQPAPQTAEKTEQTPRPSRALEVIREDPLSETEAPGPTAPAETTAPPTETAPRPFRLAYPVEGQIAESFAMDHLSYNETMRDWRTHEGVDILAGEGSPVCAAADGVVDAVWNDDFLGWSVTVRHDGGWLTRYSNLAEDVAVTAGASVRAGQRLGSVGGSALLELAQAPHLHFAVYRNDAAQDPEPLFS